MEYFWFFKSILFLFSVILADLCFAKGPFINQLMPIWPKFNPFRSVTVIADTKKSYKNRKGKQFGYMIFTLPVGFRGPQYKSRCQLGFPFFLFLLNGASDRDRINRVKLRHSSSTAGAPYQMSARLEDIFWHDYISNILFSCDLSKLQ